MKTYLKSNTLALLILLIAILAITPLKVFSLLGILIILALALPLRIDFYFRFLISFCLFFAVNSLLGAVFFVLKIPLSVSFLLVFYAGLLLLLPKQSLTKYSPSTPFNLSALAKVLLSAAAIIFLVAPVLPRDNFTAYRIVSIGGDNISHIEAVRAIRDNAGYFYAKPDLGKNTMMEGLSSYPQGMHLNMVIAMEAIQPLYNTRTNLGTMTFFYTYCVGLYVIFAGLFYLLIRGVQRKNKGRSTLGIVSVLVLFSGLFYSLFALGSQTQIASMVLFLAMLFLLEQSYSFTKTKDVLLYTAVSVILLAGISFTWLLLLPIGLLILGLFYITRLLKPLVAKPLEQIWFIAFSLIILGVAMLQPVVQVLYKTSKNAGVNEVGYSVQPSILLIIAITLLSLGFLLAVYKKTLSFWLISLFSASVFLLEVFIHQWFSLGEIRYYFYKSAYIVLLIAFILIASSCGELLNKQLQSLGRRKVVLVIVCLLISGLFVAFYNAKNPNDFFSRRTGGGFSEELSATAIELINSNPENGEKIIAVGSCNRAQDYTLTRLAGALTANNGSAHQALISAQLSQNKKILYTAIKKYQEEDSSDIIIISSDYQLQQYLETRLNDGYGSERFIDIDFGHIPKNVSSCPEAVR